MKKFKLKGCLWRPGINGFGAFGHHAPYWRDFDACGRSHDRRYDVGGGSDERFNADYFLLEDMLRQVSLLKHQRWMTTYCYLVYLIVRLFGWLFFRYTDVK